jgi:hypothetical protein
MNNPVGPPPTITIGTVAVVSVVVGVVVSVAVDDDDVVDIFVLSYDATLQKDRLHILLGEAATVDRDDHDS